MFVKFYVSEKVFYELFYELCSLHGKTLTKYIFMLLIITTHKSE